MMNRKKRSQVVEDIQEKLLIRSAGNPGEANKSTFATRRQTTRKGFWASD